MIPKSSRVIFASHCSTGSPSGFSKDNLGPYEGESICDKYQIFTVNPAAVAMTNEKITAYRSTGRWKRWFKLLGADRFSLKVNPDHVFSVLTRNSKSTVWSSSQALHQSFRAQTAARCCFPRLRPPVFTNAEKKQIGVR